VGESGDGVEGARKLGISPEEIDKVKQEWEIQQKQKKDKEAAKQKEDKEETDRGESKGSDKTSKIPGTLAAASTPRPPLTHQRFTLHRDIFALRLSEHRKRRQAAQAKLLAPMLPGAPSGGFA